MNGCNLTARNPSIKLMVGALLTLIAAALSVSCSEDISINTTGEVDYNGSYAAASIVEMPDDATEYVYGGGDLSGLMHIRDSIYTLEVFFRAGESVFGRSDSGKFIVSGDFLKFNTVVDTFLQSVPWGEFNEERNELKINYLKNDHLWTETWKRAVPVVDSDTSSNYIPY